MQTADRTIIGGRAFIPGADHSLSTGSPSGGGAFLVPVVTSGSDPVWRERLLIATERAATARLGQAARAHGP